MTYSKGKRNSQLNLFQIDYSSRHSVYFLLASAQNKIHILCYNPNVANSVMFRKFWLHHIVVTECTGTSYGTWEGTYVGLSGFLYELFRYVLCLLRH